MNSEWPEVELGKLLEITSSKRIFREDYVEEGIPFFRSKEVIERSDGKEISTELYITREKFNEIKKKFGAPAVGDILLTSVGTLGVSYQVEPGDEFYFKDGNLTWFRNFSDKISSRYLLCWLKSPGAKRALEMITIGSTQKALTIVSLKKIKIPLPDMDHQARIVEIYDSLTEKIRVNRQINQTLEQIAQTIFKSWFVDFEPVKAKIEAKAAGRDPERAAMSTISGKTEAELDQLTPEQYQQLSVTAALFPDELVESEIPKGWAYRDLDTICQFTAGSAFKPEYQGQPEGDYPFIKVSDMNLEGNEIFIRASQNYVDEVQRKTMNAKLHPVGATVFAKIGVALLSNRRRLLRVPTIIDNNMMSAASRDGEALSWYLFLLISSIDFTVFANGTALPYLNVSDLQKIQVVVPSGGASKSIWAAFNELVAPLFEAIYANSNQSVNLASLRDSLLPKLLSGEIPISQGI